jgi:hypothetical protein
MTKEYFMERPNNTSGMPGNYAMRGPIDALRKGKTVQFRPRGHSMAPKVKSGQLVTLEPLNERKPEKGDVVLCTIHRRVVLHLVQAVQDDRYRIGNMRGGTNGWVSIDSIWGILAKVEP